MALIHNCTHGYYTDNPGPNCPSSCTGCGFDITETERRNAIYLRDGLVKNSKGLWQLQLPAGEYDLKQDPVSVLKELGYTDSEIKRSIARHTEVIP